jgi:hypothetical protein
MATVEQCFHSPRPELSKPGACSIPWSELAALLLTQLNRLLDLLQSNGGRCRIDFGNVGEDEES